MERAKLEREAGDGPGDGPRSDSERARVTGERPYVVMTIFAVLLGLAFVASIFESRRRSERRAVTEINISYSPDLAANSWATTPAFRTGGYGHARELTGATPTLTLPEGPSVVVGPISNAYLRLAESGNAIRSLKIQELPGDQAECVQRMKELAAKLRLSLNRRRTSIDEWAATQMENYGLSRFTHVETFGQSSEKSNCEIIFEIIPVPSPDRQRMVMITVWWGD